MHVPFHMFHLLHEKEKKWLTSDNFKDRDTV